MFQELLRFDQPEMLHKAAGLIFGLFKIDLELLTLALLHDTVPAVLQAPSLMPPAEGGSGCKMLTDPRGRALAKLCVMLLVSLNVARKSTPGEYNDSTYVQKPSMFCLP